MFLDGFQVSLYLLILLTIVSKFNRSHKQRIWVII